MAKGIRRHRARWRAYVRVNGELRTKTFPLDTPPSIMQGWIAGQRQARNPRIAQGTLEADVAAYLKTVTHMPTYQERKRHLDLWVAALGGHRSRYAITTTEIDQVLSRWKTKGKAGEKPLSTTQVRHRRTALLHFYRRLDGKHAPNPVRDSWRPIDPPPEPRAIPPDLVAKILAEVRGPKTRARLWVMATTGLPQSTLGKLTPADVEDTRVRIPGRRKGAGAAGRWFPLYPAAKAALKAFADAKAWGPFSTGGMRSRWQDALKRLKLPPSLRPYDLRHSFGTLLYQQTGDLATVARLLGHVGTSTTVRYSLDAHAALDAAAVAKVGVQLPETLPTRQKRRKK